MTPQNVSFGIKPELTDRTYADRVDTSTAAIAAIARISFGLVVFAIISAAIYSRPPKRLSDFDQLVYLTIAYDIERYGVFSSGVFDSVDSTAQPASPGMSFGPTYPWIVLAVMKMDSRFAEAVRCSVETSRGYHDVASCETYATPIHFAHSVLLTLAILAIACAAEIMFIHQGMFWLSGALATAAVLPETDLFSFAMTESTTLFSYSALAVVMVLFYSTRMIRFSSLGGVLLGLLALTRAEFVFLFPILLGLICWRRRERTESNPLEWWQPLTFVAAFLLILGPWMIRNAISVGRVGITEEYGSASIIERLAFDDMTAGEFALAGLYCVGTIGPRIVDGVFGEKAMRRFHYDQDGSFFAVGRGHRNELIATYGKLDPLIGGLIKQELLKNWWRYFLVMIPLAWCGMWVGVPVSLLLLPLFLLGAVRSARASNSHFAMYYVPAFAMLALHAAVANHYTRYNLILIGPFSIGASSVVLGWTRRFLAPQLSFAAASPQRPDLGQSQKTSK